MAKQPQDLNKLKKELENLILRYEKLTGNPAAIFSTKNVKETQNAIDILVGSISKAEDEILKINGGFEGLRQSIIDINTEFGKQKDLTKDITKLYSVAEKIAKEIQYHENGISDLNAKQLKLRVDKVKIIESEARIKAEDLINEKSIFNINDKQFQEILEKNKLKQTLNKQEEKYIASRLAATKDLSREEQAIIRAYIDQHSELSLLTASIEKQLQYEKEIEKTMGITGALMKGMSRIPFLGDLPGMSSALGEVEQEIREINKLRSEKGDKSISKVEALQMSFKKMGGVAKQALTDPFVIGGFLLKQFWDILKSVDEQTGELAKSFNMSYNEASNLRSELNTIAGLSGNNVVTTKGLQETLIAVGNALGSNAKLNQEDLITWTKLREQAGYTNDELLGIYKISTLNGKSLEKNTKEFLGAAKATASTNGLIINEKQLLKEVAGVSNSIKLSMGGSASKIAEAMVSAKKLGTNLSEVESIANSLMNFESSIANELEAELLTGKQLNLEKARLAALNNDYATVATEITKQIGSAADYTKMNRIQQEALAKSVGMSRDSLADTLQNQEALNKLSGEEGKTAKDKFDNLVARVGLEKAKSQLGDEELAKQYEQQSIAEKLNNTVEKLKDIFVRVAQAIMPLLNILTKVLEIVGFIIKGISLVGGLIDKIPGMDFGDDWVKGTSNNSQTKFAKGGIVTKEINNATIGEAGPEAIIPLKSPSANKILGNNPTNVTNTDNKQLIDEVKGMKELLAKILAKEGVVNLDSTKVGTTTNVGTYKIQ